VITSDGGLSNELNIPRLISFLRLVMAVTLIWTLIIGTSWRIAIIVISMIGYVYFIELFGDCIVNKR